MFVLGADAVKIWILKQEKGLSPSIKNKIGLGQYHVIQNLANQSCVFHVMVLSAGSFKLHFSSQIP